MSYIIAVSNEKGGVAKTTTTMSLGAALAENGRKVLLVDLDAQGNLTLAAGLEPKELARTSRDVLLDGELVSNAIVPTRFQNLDVVPANSRMDQAESLLPVRLNYANLLRDALQQGNTGHDYILFDCPPVLGAVTLNALTAAQLLIVPTQAEYFSIYALRDMMALIRRVRSETNPDLSYRILITLLDQRNRTHRTIREQLQQTFGVGLFDTVIEVDTKLRESPIAGTPITQFKPGSRGSLQYKALALELIEYVQQADPEQAH
jgi:chromosome partitioning protein